MTLKKRVLVSKIMATVLATSTVLGVISSAVSADDTTDYTVSSSSPTRQASASSKFEVDTNILGYNVNVAIPNSIDLSYDKDNGVMTNTKNITASGLVPDDKILKISTLKDITCTLSGSTTITAPCSLAFESGTTTGSVKGDIAYQTWTAAELAADSGTSKTITPTVAISSIPRVGLYSTSILFDISLE